MFIKNKYTKWYFNIIDNAENKSRVKNDDCYYENHHIIPGALGGSNNKENLVLLTGKEHFICHWLLTKMTNKDNKCSMMYALQGMRRISITQKRYDTPITARVYNRLKSELSIIQSIKYSGKCNPMYGRSAIKENNLRWYKNGKHSVFIPFGTEKEGYVLGRYNEYNYNRILPKKAVVSPMGEIFLSLQEAADAYEITVGALRERIRRNERNSKMRKNKSFWSFYTTN